MSTPFQTAVKSAVHHTTRREAIERLAERDEHRHLALLVQMGGLRGEFRRQALECLNDRNANAELEELAEDTTLEPSLQRRATDLV
ncbi:hypothetical protein [Natronorubrum daqingense]|uniref:HEAT repeat domain-containing protein n=1 Tax=Natronorubrum daqingense TaxID=588898 RepID=A0A1N6ZZJ3_9EURY|nr:hypothetical protein [Natronorubrum daqingense]APX95192.1 hypothetical protein BB347_00450 [Natronorubrum daqingense]SIR32242.1 hypothetical protein SAMN05421809_0974 [Natronorubrum daqingense]